MAADLLPQGAGKRPDGWNADRLTGPLLAWPRYGGAICNRNKLDTDVAELKIQLRFDNLPNFPPQGEFFPKRAARVVRQKDGARKLAQMTWGFPPPANAKAPVTNVRNLS